MNVRMVLFSCALLFLILMIGTLVVAFSAPTGPDRTSISQLDESNLSRLKEPSTWAGVVPLVAGFAWFAMPEGFWQQGTLVLAAIAGLAAIVLKERGG